MGVTDFVLEGLEEHSKYEKNKQYCNYTFEVKCSLPNTGIVQVDL